MKHFSFFQHTLTFQIEPSFDMFYNISIIKKKTIVHIKVIEYSMTTENIFYKILHKHSYSINVIIDIILNFVMFYIFFWLIMLYLKICTIYIISF